MSADVGAKRVAAILETHMNLGFGYPLLLLACTTGISAEAVSAEMPLRQSTTEKEKALNKSVPSLLSEYDVPSIGVAYIEGGEIAFVRHYGFQTWGFPANELTLYNVASLTKPVTAEVVLRLIDAGVLTLDTPLARSFVDPDIAGDPRSREVTPRIVLNHRTGFPNWRHETGGILQFHHNPDTQTGYSGEGYEWMMKAVAAFAGDDFEDLAEKWVFAPVGMKRTSYTLTQNFVGHLAVPYKAGEAVYNVVRREPSASDDLRTTPREYARFMIDVFEGDAVSIELREQQRTIRDHIADKPACRGEDRPTFCPTSQGWGLGWFIHDYGDRKIFEHSGGDHGEKAFAFYDPQAKRGAVILTNGANGNEIMNRVAGMLDGDQRFAEYMLAPFTD